MDYSPIVYSIILLICLLGGVIPIIYMLVTLSTMSDERWPDMIWPDGRGNSDKVREEFEDKTIKNINRKMWSDRHREGATPPVISNAEVTSYFIYIRDLLRILTTRNNLSVRACLYSSNKQVVHLPVQHNGSEIPRIIVNVVDAACVSIRGLNTAVVITKYNDVTDEDEVLFKGYITDTDIRSTVAIEIGMNYECIIGVHGRKFIMNIGDRIHFCDKEVRYFVILGIIKFLQIYSKTYYPNDELVVGSYDFCDKLISVNRDIPEDKNTEIVEHFSKMFHITKLN